MKKFAVFAVLLAAAVLALVAGYQVYTQKKAEEAERARQEQIHQAFEDLLNGALRDTVKRASDYKQARHAALDLTEAKNLAKPGYAKENLALFKNITAQLDDNAEAILGVFSQARGQVAALAAALEEPRKSGVLAAWKKVEDAQGARYVEFLGRDRETLSAARAVLEFCAARDGHYQADDTGKALAFDTPADQEAYDALRARLDTLRAGKDIDQQGNQDAG